MAEQQIFRGFGIEVFQDRDSFSILYDHGGVAVKYRKDVVSRDEALQAQKSEAEAYKFLLVVMKRNGI